MPLTNNVKKRSINVSTGEETIEYYDQVEWDALEAARPAAELAAAKEVNVQRIKDEASQVILHSYPFHRQMNMNARMHELRDVHATIGSWTVAEQGEVDAMRSVWTWVKEVRAHSKVLRNAMNAATDAGDVAFQASMFDTYPVS